MGLPTEHSIHCNNCTVYNVDNCFCDECLREVKEKYLDGLENFMRTKGIIFVFTSNLTDGSVASYEKVIEQYKKEVV